jgi:hypothetical protein
MVGHSKPEAILAAGGPEGKADGAEDSLYLDNSNAILYIKTTPRGTKTGWFCLGQILRGSTMPAQFAATPDSERRGR